MKLTAKLAHSQLKTNRSRSIWTLIGIIFATAMITAVYSFAATGMATIFELTGTDIRHRQEYKYTMIAMGAVLSIIVISAAVIVISNAFRVSAGERAGQFGILKSTGATKRQIAETVIFEGLFLSAVGIPAGVILGLLVELAGVKISDYFLRDINKIASYQLGFDFVISWQAIALSIAVSFVTVFLSAWFPARKAAKVPAIDAIRGAGDVKIKAKKFRTNPLIQKIFGFEGTLAAKSLKRSRRNFRATVASLSVSIILFMAANTIGVFGEAATHLVYQDVDANVSVYIDANTFHAFSEDDENVAEITFSSIDYQTAEEITAVLRQNPDTTGVFTVGSVRGYNNSISTRTILDHAFLTAKMREAFFYDYSEEQGGYDLGVHLITVDKENYERLCAVAGVPVGSNILVNYIRQRTESKREEFQPLVFGGQTIELMGEISSTELTLHGELQAGDIPKEIMLTLHAPVNIIIPESEYAQYIFYVKTDNISGFMDFYTYDYFYDTFMIDRAFSVSVINMEQEMAAMRGISGLIMTFIYGFVGMLTLIGLTNVISTISANVRIREKEFAVLKSVGMTRKGLNRMLGLESIFCSLKSLIIGLPLGILASYGIWRSITISFGLMYSFPLLAITQCIIAVTAITWVAMRFSVSRLRGKSIVGAIRG
ncbi:MAG: ABC transporter permease [Oscillospiraceae bacterium]|nr:ABC transporter permease [Oscillospiraceae bacterium]